MIRLIDWLTCKKELNALGFTDDEISLALTQIEYTERDLTDEVFYENMPRHLNPFELVREGSGTIKKYMGEYSKEVKVNGYYIKQKAQYQGLRHGKLIKQLLSNRYSWFNTFEEIKEETQKPDVDRYCRLKDLPEEFDGLTLAEIKNLTLPVKVQVTKSLWDIFEMYNSEHYEIYLKTEFGSLYVPIQAILSSDFSLIGKRMKEYHSWYHKASSYNLNHRGRTKEQFDIDNEESYLKSIKPLDSKEAIQLKSFLTKE